MKILAISGSHRRGGNTKILLEEALKTCKEEGADTELVELAGMKIEYCQAHDSTFCREKGCVFKDDAEDAIKMMQEADGIIIGSPVYLGTMTSRLKAFLDRACRLRRLNFALSKKVGAAIAIGGAQGGGQELTIVAIHSFMFIQDMTVVSDGVDTAHFGVVSIAGDPGEASKDKKAIEVARNLGKRVVEELKQRK